jgi:hypothetical protein
LILLSGLDCRDPGFGKKNKEKNKFALLFDTKVEKGFKVGIFNPYHISMPWLVDLPANVEVKFCFLDNFPEYIVGTIATS